MTQPADAPLYATPAANQARASAIEVYTQYEAALYAAYLDMITGWLEHVRQAVFAGGIKALNLIPDPYTVYTQTPRWAALVDTYTETVVADVLAHAYQQVLPGVQEFASRPFVQNFVATSANKMKNTPNEVFALVRQIIDSATTNGASIPDIADQIDKLLTATGTDTWKTRAQTVARTEVHAAYEGGMYDAFAMLVEADTETEYVARWLATEDERTRPTHRKADGETVPFGTPFSIGGYPMLYPGDPAGPASEVINCRCTLLLEEKDQPTNMSNRGFKMTGSLADYAAENSRPRPPRPRRTAPVIPAGGPPMTLAQAAQFGFNPLEKRDSSGKWTLGGKIKEALKGDKPGPGGDVHLHGYGKQFEGKTVHKIAKEHAAGKHTAESLPDDVREYLGMPKTPPRQYPTALAPRDQPDMVETDAGWVHKSVYDQAARDASLLRQEARRLDDLEEHGASGPDAARILRQAERYRHETPAQRLKRLRGEAAALDMD